MGCDGKLHSRIRFALRIVFALHLGNVIANRKRSPEDDSVGIRAVGCSARQNRLGLPDAGSVAPRF
jgi:hypothetical protein